MTICVFRQQNKRPPELTVWPYDQPLAWERSKSEIGKDSYADGSQTTGRIKNMTGKADSFRVRSGMSVISAMSARYFWKSYKVQRYLIVAPQ
jgi:hypothetical protein